MRAAATTLGARGLGRATLGHLGLLGSSLSGLGLEAAGSSSSRQRVGLQIIIGFFATTPPPPLLAGTTSNSSSSSSAQAGPEAGAGPTPRSPTATQAAAHPAAHQAAPHHEQCEQVVDSQAEKHRHLSHRAPWLRALVLGANDGLVSNSALLMGVGAGSADLDTLLLSGAAGLVGGALSMGCGEYISVASQRDAEKADIAKEIAEQQKGPSAQATELEELACIYVQRGLPPPLAHKVAVELTRRDVIRAHARDELGIDVDELVNPLQACVVSAVSFSAGAALPLLAAASAGDWAARTQAVAAVSTVGLAAFGALGAKLGGASIMKGGARVVLGGASIMKGGARVVLGGWLAMGITFAVGSLFGASPHA